MNMYNVFLFYLHVGKDIIWIISRNRNEISNIKIINEYYNRYWIIENTINIKVVVNNMYYNIYIDRFHDFSLDLEMGR